jgi:hypothetical protein
MSISICHIIVVVIVLELLFPAFHAAKASLKVVLVTGAVGLLHIIELLPDAGQCLEDIAEEVKSILFPLYSKSK